MRVNRGTKIAEHLISDMTRHYWKGNTLYECYKTVSSEKVKSWEKIRQQCSDLNGERLHMVGANCHTYSCMYAYPVTDEETGVITAWVLRKETHGNTYELELSPEEYNEVVIARDRNIYV